MNATVKDPIESIQYKNTVMDKVESYLAKTGISANQLAHLSNVNSGNLSRMRKGDFQSINHIMFDRLLQYMEGKQQPGTLEWKIINSRSIQTIDKVCEEAKKNARMLAVFGHTGCGKTTAFKRFQRTNPTGTRYIKCNSLMNRKRFLAAICKAFGLETSGTSPVLYERFIDWANGRRGLLLILDNLHKIKREVIELIHELREDTEDDYSLGLVLAGTERFKTDFGKWEEQNKTCFQELCRRIGYWEAIERPERPAIKAIAERFGIKDTKAINYITKQAGKDFGTLQEFLTEAHRLADGRPIDLSLLQQVR